MAEENKGAAPAKPNGSDIEDVRIDNMNKLVDVLVEEINLLRRGRITPSRANAMANLNGKIMQAVKLSIETHKYVQKLDQSTAEIPLVSHTRNQMEKLDAAVSGA
jgi:hypothetical protein